ncbi:MAG: thiamine-phosphate kinase [Gemmatimonadota bacterium]|nr:MAG: thiamine-phosphate kinase [Gemmatimonadota bacterium]
MMTPPDTRRSAIRLGPGAEFDLIRRLLEEAPGAIEGVAVGPGDDAAVLEVDGRVVLSSDLAMEGVHFRRQWLTLPEIGYRAVAAAMSDLAAMAARPIGVLVSLAIPGAEAAESGPAIHDGIREACGLGGACLLGGDLTGSPGPLVLDIMVVGSVERPITRSGARAGDELWVTGVLGGAAGAVTAWEAGGDPDPALRSAYARPVPRIGEARWLAEDAGVTAMIDLSDGLAGDAGHLAAASGVGIVIEESLVPTHAGLTSDLAMTLAFTGGEDYELCVSVPGGRLGPLAGDFESRFGVRLTRVGYVADGDGVSILRPGAASPEPLHGSGFNHFTVR